MRTKKVLGWMVIALITANIATAQTDHVVKWIGETSSDWYGTSNWLELVHGDHGPVYRQPGTNDVVHWDFNWTNATFINQPILSGANATVDELRVGTAPTNVILTINDGSLKVTRHSSQVYAIRMNVARVDLTITGDGTFIQGNTHGDSQWRIDRLPENQGDLTIDTAGFVIEDQVLTIKARSPRTVTINSSASPSAASINKTSTGTLLLRGQNQWTGYTKIAGTLELGPASR